jgi:hypothetical protein
LLAFVRQLPVGMAYTPIYAKGCKLVSGTVSKGKTPLERAHHADLNPADVALQIERRPDVFRAVGVFTGARSKGLVILDVDRNLAKLKTKWGTSLEGAPVVTSTKPNAAKYLFRVPEELWPEVKGFGLSDTGAGYEVLWGRQGLLYGAYPGSTDGKGPEGFYGFVGDLEAIPEAPAWVLAEMKDHAGKEVADGGFIKNRKALDFSDRDPGEVAEIIQSALRVIPGQGAGSRDHWVKVGMAIHSELPTDIGLTLWAAWSADDPEYAEEWADANPCEEVWRSFKKGPVSLGTLFWMADQQMPGRLWLPEDLRKVVTEAEQDRVQRWEKAYPDGKQVLEQAYKLEEEIDNPALLGHAKHVLGLQSGHAQGAQAIDKMLDADMAYERSKNLAPIPVAELEDTPFEYLIPGLLPKPWTLLIHADGGTGKTAMCQTIAKHLAQGRPFDCFGALVDVPKSKVLWLNGDQNERIVRRQFMQLGVNEGVEVIGEWDMTWYRKFRQIQNKHKYDLVVIDSLDGCNDANPYEENKREFALPLKKLARRNGIDFPACAIIVIHHNTKTGTFRGTSAIRAAVDETWNMRRANQQEIVERGLLPQSRIVTVEKSRDDREGVEMTFRLLKDFTYQIRHLKAREGAVRGPSEHVQALLELLRSDQRPWCLKEICEHPDFADSHLERANEYAVKKLEQQNLIQRCAPPAERSFKGRPPVFYCARAGKLPGFTSLTRGDAVGTFGKLENPVLESDLSFPKGFGKVEFRKTPDPGTPPAGTAPGTFPKEDFSESHRKTQTPVQDSDLDFSETPRVYRVSGDPQALERVRDEAASYWD